MHNIKQPTTTNLQTNPNRRENNDAGTTYKKVMLCQLLDVTIASWFNIPLKELRASSRRRANVAFARQVAMYLAHVSLGMTLTEIGRQFKRDRTTAAHACRLIEDMRDDPNIDSMIDDIEKALLNWCYQVFTNWS